MTPLTIAKITLALAAAIFFAFGVRGDHEELRWAAIGCLVVAVLLRFIDRPGRRND